MGLPLIPLYAPCPNAPPPVHDGSATSSIPVEETVAPRVRLPAPLGRVNVRFCVAVEAVLKPVKSSHHRLCAKLPEPPVASTGALDRASAPASTPAIVR